MNIDPGSAVRPFGHDARNERHLVVEQVRHSINRDGFQCRISENDFLVTFRRRVAFIGGVDVRPKNATHWRQLRQEHGQEFFGLFFGRLVWRNFSEASADFGFEPSVQISDSSASCLGQIFGTHQRLAAKSRKHQAHQLGASGLDGQARWQGGGSVEVIYTASFAVSLKQVGDCMVHVRIHHRNYATAWR